jgi:hypothetical protein
MHITTVSNKDGSVEIYFEQLNFREEFEVILELLEKENGCQVIDEQDIGDSRKAVLRFDNVEFSLRHNYIFGNFLYTTEERDVVKLEQLAKNVIDSIQEKLRLKGITL